MKDPFGSMHGFLSKFQNFMQDPSGAMLNRAGINREAFRDPNKAIQGLLDTGKMTQQQYNYLKRMASAIENSPAFRAIMRPR